MNLNADTAADPQPTLETIRAAHARIAPYIHRTPVMTSRTLSEMAGATLAFKCENLQKAGAFKTRGATNTLFLLTDDQARKGVVTHSSGNHAAALALAGQSRGVTVDVVMPRDARQIKQDAVRSYGGQITFCEPTLASREQTAHDLCRRTGGTLVHPYDDHRIIAGQGTVALEFLEQCPDLDMLLLPVGGGGLLAGSLIAAKALKPGIEVIGVEPALADDAYRSLKAGRILPIDTIPPRDDAGRMGFHPVSSDTGHAEQPVTIADGLRTTLGQKTFPIIAQQVDRILLVDEHDIVAAMRWILVAMKLVVEPSAAVPLAALLSGRLDAKGCRVGIVLSGGNIDPWNLEPRLPSQGR